MSEEHPQKPDKTARAGPGYFEVIVIALIIAVVAVAGYDRLFAQKIQVLDLTGYLRTRKALLAAGEISPQEWKAGLDAVERVLNNTEANHPNHVILLKDVVLRNGEELKVDE